MCGFLAYSGKFDEDFYKKVVAAADEVSYRGPDNTTVVKLASDHGIMSFHRLAIMDLSFHGNQPFQGPKSALVCNGEIYNYKNIKTDYLSRYKFESESDCETLIPLYEEYGIEKLCEVVDAEFALVIYDKKSEQFIAARDPMGIRPLFYGKSKFDGSTVFASEMKSLTSICNDIKTFPPGHFYKDGEFTSYLKLSEVVGEKISCQKEALKGIKDLLVESVGKRICSDAPLGYLLSGGLDSSLVCSIANKLTDKKITTFAVGFEECPIDLKYAKVVADYLGSDHHEVIFTREEILNSLESLIYRLETYDITTIRASVGMDLVCRYVKDKTDIKVLLTGEVSDEIFGYKYTDFAPSALEFQKEAAKRVDELFMYDVLRADRCISSNSLEARVPFSDKAFVSHVMKICPTLKMNTTGVGKYLLRKAFDDEDYLPESILYREKAAFSDAVGHGMVDYLKELAEKKYSDEEFKKRIQKYDHATPFSKESLMYREIFEKFFEGKSKMVSDFWMPNKEWENCDVQDPSARVLPNYGKSGK